MKVANFILALGVLALASSLPLPTILALSRTFVWQPMMLTLVDPEHVTADDFFYSGLMLLVKLQNSGSTYQSLTVDSIHGLNTNGLSIVRIDYEANGGLNPPHHHPRASEILTVLEGTLYAGFISSNPDHRVFSKVLKAGDVFVFPLGLIHFQLNIGKTPAVAIAALNSQNPGVVTTANTVFGASPSLVPDVLTRAFHLDKDLVTKLQKQEWVNPSELNSYSNSY
ncbi:hypothetical protein GH714_041684 [Hevea brasiliensis]|uniref:Germin-like protein n=1 Tax=Hevea brasiliensis TaxID=3981 RepID=A0A6A6MVX4_HEVBR|nr:hypothetical protein GH714_041684 [Hevea brasiliensis]